MLTPVVEYDVDASTGGGAGIRRHSVSEMTSCLEESSSSVAETTTTAINNTSDTSTSSLADHSPASTASAELSGTATLLEKKHNKSLTMANSKIAILAILSGGINLPEYDMCFGAESLTFKSYSFAS